MEEKTLYLSLQGCMAVGKTTAAKYVDENCDNIYVSYEEHKNVKRKIEEKNYNIDIYADYIEIQKLWIESSIKRYEKTKMHKYVLMDFGSEDIEFFTYNYPISKGYDWDIENALRDELNELKKYQPYRILFLEADEELIRKRKEKDILIKRASFEHHLTKLLPLKREWFKNKENVDFLDVNNLSGEELGKEVLLWAKKVIKV